MRMLTPWGKRGRVLNLPHEAVIAYPCTGASCYRLVVHDPPSVEDFQPTRPALAEKRGYAEITRLALSHFSKPEEARAAMWAPHKQMVARVTLPNSPRIHVARTEKELPGHYDIWIPLDLLEEIVETVEILD